MDDALHKLPGCCNKICGHTSDPVVVVFSYTDVYGPGPRMLNRR